MTTESLRVLFISAVPTDPPDAGNRVRIMTLTRSLIAAGHEVHFAYFPMESCDLPAMQARFGPDRLHVLHSRLEPPRGGLLSRAARKLGRLMNIEQAFVWGLDDWYDERANSELAALHSLHEYDAVFVEYVFASKALEAFPPDCLRVLDTHDCFGLRHRLYLKAGMRPQWFSTSMADEDSGFRRADIVLAIQASESRDFKARVEGSKTRVLQVGHLIDIADAAPPSRREAAVFLGSANPINVAGARHFIDRVLPIVRRTKPGFQLLLAGAVSAEFEDQDGVVKLGFVPNLQDAFGAAMIAVNPVLVGTGVNIKLLDAMASAMPIVTTRSGARGVEELDGHALFVVEDEDPGAFANRILELIDDADARCRISARARSAAEQWNAAQVSTLVGALVRKSTRCAARDAAKPSQSRIAIDPFNLGGT